MYTICYRMMKDHALAEDTLQEAFVEVFKSIKSYEFKSTLGVWIKTIVIRKAIKHLKSQVVLERLEDVPTSSKLEAPNELTRLIWSVAYLICQLDYRTVFLLIEVEGYKHSEVASMLGISEGTSRLTTFID